jgi:hypothetical protein
MTRRIVRTTIQLGVLTLMYVSMESEAALLRGILRSFIPLHTSNTNTDSLL